MFRLFVLLAFAIAACGPSLEDGGSEPASGDGSTGAATTSGALGSSGGTETGDDGTSPDGSTGSVDSTSGEGSSETGEVPTALCNPPDQHGAFLEFHESSDWAAFEGCDEDSIYFERPGVEPIDTVDGFDALNDAEVGLLGLPSVYGVGRGFCCDGSTMCLNVYAHRWTYSLPELFDGIDAAFGELGDVCFGIRVLLQGEEGPRCEADDPECLPLPVCEGFNDSECCEAPPLDLDAPRIPVGDDLSNGTCTHDGECLIFHTVCGDYMTPSKPGFNQCTDEIREAYCGCVDNACHWYEQG